MLKTPILGITIGLLAMDLCYAQQPAFRVETDVTVGDETKPIYRSVTLFKDGVAYDFPRDGAAVTIVDMQSNRIVLLDSARKIQATVDLAQLIRLINAAKTQPGPIKPIVEESSKVARSGDVVIVGGSKLRYEATTQRAPSEQIAVAYAKFADAVAHLNSGRRDPLALPFARLTLNRELAKQAVLPQEITKRVSLGDKSTVHRSRLHASWNLSAEHEKQIEAVQGMIAAFENVSQNDFFAPALQAVRPSSTRR